jgi:hypothetical protein
MTYQLGKIETLIESIKDRLEAHMATGEKLASIKHLWLGDRPLSGGTDTFPAIIIDIESGSTQSTTQAYSKGANTLNMVLNIRLLANKISMDNKASYAQNVLYDEAGNGIIALMQYVMYAMMFNASDVYSPIISSLDKLPMPRFTMRQEKEFYECEISYDLALRYVYEDIIGG